MSEINGKVLYLGSLEPKVAVKIQVLPRKGGGYYAATLFPPIGGAEDGNATLKTLGLNDRYRFSTTAALEEALRQEWGLEPIEGGE